MAEALWLTFTYGSCEKEKFCPLAFPLPNSAQMRAVETATASPSLRTNLGSRSQATRTEITAVQTWTFGRQDGREQPVQAICPEQDGRKLRVGTAAGNGPRPGELCARNSPKMGKKTPSQSPGGGGGDSFWTLFWFLLCSPQIEGISRGQWECKSFLVYLEKDMFSRAQDYLDS